MINVTLKGGVVNRYESGISVAEIATHLSMGLYKAACACTVDGVLCDLRTTLDKDCEVSILTFDDELGKKAFWHTTSHLMAQAITRLYPDVKLAIGPAIDNGFYYDMDVETPFTADDLVKIEAEMKTIVKENPEIVRYY